METVRLKILRGIELIPRDMESSDMLGTSDPFCRVYVDDELIGQTNVISRSLNPVWSGAGATFYCNVRKTSTVRVVIEDYDAWKVGLNIGVSCNPSADPMGEVTFLASNVLDGRGVPNRWFAVTPTPGCEKPTGQLEVQMSRQAAEEAPHDAPPSFTSKAAARRILPGPRYEKSPLEYLVGVSPSSLLHRAARARAPVWLHIYDVGHAKVIRNVNAATELTVGGVFHGAIEVHGRELSFGGCKQNKCGIFACKPRQCPMHTYRESVYLGDCGLAKEQVQLILGGLKAGWMGPTYDLLRKNCCSFSRELALELGVGEVPSWIDRLAKWGTSLDNAMHGKKAVDKRRSSFKPTDVDTLFAEHIYASKMQQAFRARKLRRAASQHAATRIPIRS